MVTKKMKLSGFFACLALCGLLLVEGCGGAPQQTALPAGARVLVLGDSLSYGTGAGEDEDYPTLLAQKTGWAVINAGIPGDTSAGGLKRVTALLDEHAPQLLLLELGGNDFLRRVPRETTTANLRGILQEAGSRGIPAVLVATPQPNLFGAAVGSLSDDPIYREIAEDMGVALIEEVLAEVLSDNALKSDPIHPNAEGYRRVAEGIYLALQQQGFAR